MLLYLSMSEKYETAPCSQPGKRGLFETALNVGADFLISLFIVHVQDHAFAFDFYAVKLIIVFICHAFKASCAVV